jgi:hypothetical protein
LKKADNKIRFSQAISSPADRLFLMQINRFTSGKKVEGGILKYRVNEKSMSTISLKWTLENEAFFNILVSENLNPPLYLDKQHSKIIYFS